MKNSQVSIRNSKLVYNAAKTAKVGAEIICPCCAKKFIKATYQKTFCSNAKTRGRGNCKDRFWNIVDPEKKCRNTSYFRDVILSERLKDEKHFEDDDGSWDEHQCHVEKCELCNEWPENCQCGEGADIN